jgi:EasF-like predicted methyltransferase
VPTGTFSHVKCFGLFGTYDDGLAWLAKPENQAKSKCILTLGSSIGNFDREEAAGFLKGFANLLNHSDSMLVGIDACQKKSRVYAAYNDKEGVTHAFYRNGLSHANALLGYEAFKQEEWEVIGLYNDCAHRHEAYFAPLKDITIDGISLQRGERIRLEEAYKYSGAQREVLCHAAGLNLIASFGNAADDYRETPFLFCYRILSFRLRNSAALSSPFNPTQLLHTAL